MAQPTIQVIFPPFDLRVAYGKAADRLSAFVGKDVTLGLAGEIRNLIVARTRSGQGIAGTFAPYEKSTQNSKGVGPQPVTLTGPGRWLDMLMGKIDEPGDAIVIRFDDTEATEIFTFHQGGTKNMEKREWLGLTSEEELFVFAAMQRIVDTQTVPDMCMVTGLPRS